MFVLWVWLKFSQLYKQQTVSHVETFVIDTVNSYNSCSANFSFYFVQYSTVDPYMYVCGLSKSCVFLDCLHSDRLGELERDKARLTEQLVAQQREHLAKEIDFYKKSKSKNLLKKGFKKLKGKIQVS